jgi:hypothetical protein
MMAGAERAGSLRSSKGFRRTMRKALIGYARPSRKL